MRHRSRAQGKRSGKPAPTIDPDCCVAEVMGTDLFTITPDTVVGSARRLANVRRIDHFLVIEDGSLTGIVCQSDLHQVRENALVSDCMTSPVLCIGPETTVEDAADIMERNEVGCLPVITGTFLVGMITRDRLSKLTGKGVRTSVPPLGEEDDEEPAEPLSCSVCGRQDHVKPYFRAGMQPLCRKCAGVLPPIDIPKAN